jgi:hypothetical protein
VVGGLVVMVAGVAVEAVEGPLAGIGASDGLLGVGFVIFVAGVVLYLARELRAR